MTLQHDQLCCQIYHFVYTIYAASVVILMIRLLVVVNLCREMYLVRGRVTQTKKWVIEMVVSCVAVTHRQNSKELPGLTLKIISSS